MVASAHRIARRSDFTRTLKSGVRVSTRDLVVHVLDVRLGSRDAGVETVGTKSVGTKSVGGDAVRAPLVTVGGPWLGLIVSKAVGNAVTRHQVARRLRAAFRATLTDCPSDQALVIVRARSGAADCSSVELARQLRSAYRKPAMTNEVARMADEATSAQLVRR